MLLGTYLRLEPQKDVAPPEKGRGRMLKKKEAPASFRAVERRHLEESYVGTQDQCTTPGSLHVMG